MIGKKKFAFSLLICISLNTTEVGLITFYMLWPSECLLFISLARFSIGSFILLLLVSKDSLYITDINFIV